MATKTYEELLRSQRAAADKQVAAAAKEKKQADAKALATATGIVDKQLDSQKEPYRAQLEEAPEEYQTLFDRNALQEELGRQAVELKMANMGMTDSGLNASSQAALSAQRMNADAAARKSMREYVNELQAAIHALEAKGAAQKAQLRLKSDAAYDEWYADIRKEAYTQADKTAAALYEAALDAAAAQQKKSSAKTESSYRSQTGSGSGSQTDAGNKAVSAVVPQDMSLGLQLGAQTVADGVYGKASLQAVTAAVDEVEEMDASSGGIFNTTFWLGPTGDGEDVYQDIVEEQLVETAGFRALDEAQKACAIAMAIGKSVAITWPDSGQGRNNTIRMEAALKMAQETYGWSEEEYRELKALARQTYSETA